MATEEKSLVADDFAALFGCNVTALPANSRALIARGDWRYAPVSGEELDEVVGEILQRIREKNFSIAVPGDNSRWERGWAENLKDFLKTGGDPETLAPKYIRSNKVVRLFGRFVRPREPRFEFKWFEVFQDWLFHAYFADCETIFEFGCGSGINVARLAEMFPDKRIVGLDWAAPSCEIVNSMRKLHGWNTEGRPFNFFEPDNSLLIPPNSIVLTLAALEQTSTRYGAFIDFLLATRPKRCVFIEPIYEWYDPANLADYLAIRTHDVRNFWKGFPTLLHQLAAEGRVEILKEKRTGFGSLLHEAYSQIIWRPL